MVIELNSMSFSIEIFSYCNPVDFKHQHSHIYANTTRATPMLQCSHLFRTDRQLDDKHTGLEAHNCDWWIFRSSNADFQIYGRFRCERTMMVLMAFTVYPQHTPWMMTRFRDSGGRTWSLSLRTQRDLPLLLGRRPHRSSLTYKTDLLSLFNPIFSWIK